MADEDPDAPDEINRTIIVDYDTEKERKRSTYQLDEKSDNFEPYEGLQRRFSGPEEEFDKIYGTLVEKVGEYNIRVERADEIDMGTLEASTTTTYDLEVEEGPVDGFLNYWFQSKAPGGKKNGDKTFDLYSNKFGRASVEYETQSTDSGTRIETHWEAGNEEALSGFTEKFEEELDFFENSQL